MTDDQQKALNALTILSLLGAFQVETQKAPSQITFAEFAYWVKVTSPEAELTLLLDEMLIKFRTHTNSTAPLTELPAVDVLLTTPVSSPTA
jgi:hypothetical protein